MQLASNTQNSRDPKYIYPIIYKTLAPSKNPNLPNQAYAYAFFFIVFYPHHMCHSAVKMNSSPG